MVLPEILVLVADGSEEMEAVTCVDVLRRAGLKVTLASVTSSLEVVCSRQVKLVADTLLKDIEHKDVFGAIVLPGGAKGAEAFANSNEVKMLLQHYSEQGKLVAAICAAPIALAAANIQKGKNLTSHPSVKDKLAEEYTYGESRVIIDGNIITSRGPGTAIEFSLSIIKYLLGNEKAQEVAKPMLLPESFLAVN
jgi:protein DJ-1